MGYYTPSGTAFGPAFAVSNIQWTGLTHVIESAAYVNADGTLDLTGCEISSTAAALVSAAHANNVKALLSIGQSTYPNLPDAISNHLSALVTNVMAAVNTYGFDGVDIDWEPFYLDTESTAMTSLSAALRSALGSKLLTVAVSNWSTYWGTNPYFDRFNIMTYFGTGTWNAAGLWFTNGLYASGADSIYTYSLAWFSWAYQYDGVPAAKLGLGISFFGSKWTGGTLASDPTHGISGPRQAWQTGGAPRGPTAITYAAILPLITGQNYYWDAAAVVPYLGVPGTPSTSWYLTYDNPQSIAAKVQYAIAQGLGGWIIWALDEDYVPGNSHPHPLLDAVQVGSAPVVLSPSVLSTGTVSTIYNASLGASGAAPLRWSFSGGSLPAGLSLSSTGVISGTPTTAGTSTFVVTVDNFAGTASRSFTIMIAASAS
jgi:chitinase